MVAPPPVFKANGRAGFTLVEMSIVLVIIGLIIGGVLVGRDLIAAAAIRSQISQIEKFRSAVNTFYGKYGALPGDIPDPLASQSGLAARGTNPGQGDGNGVLEQYANGWGFGTGIAETGGELLQFWSDLTYANGMNINLIPGSFSSVTPSSQLGGFSYANVNKYFPSASIGQGNYVYVFSLGWASGSSWQSSATNYFGVEDIISSGGTLTGNPGLTVKQAYDIDRKIDDGMPQTGRVQAWIINGSNVTWVGAGFASPWSGAYTTATSPTSSTCFDNGGVAGQQQYSLSQNNGAGINCALSFRF
jgi:prepilin-type N-terminal cleavage/methylation domain-containing protein